MRFEDLNKRLMEAIDAVQPVDEVHSAKLARLRDKVGTSSRDAEREFEMVRNMATKDDKDIEARRAKIKEDVEEARRFSAAFITALDEQSDILADITQAICGRR